MIDVNALRGKIKKNGLTEYQVASHIGMSAKTFSLKMKKGVFGTDEASLMIELLDIEDPEAVFFANEETPTPDQTKADEPKGDE